MKYYEVLKRMSNYRNQLVLVCISLVLFVIGILCFKNPDYSERFANVFQKHPKPFFWSIDLMHRYHLYYEPTFEIGEKRVFVPKLQVFDNINLEGAPVIIFNNEGIFYKGNQIAKIKPMSELDSSIVIYVYNDRISDSIVNNYKELTPLRTEWRHGDGIGTYTIVFDEIRGDIGIIKNSWNWLYFKIEPSDEFTIKVPLLKQYQGLLKKDTHLSSMIAYINNCIDRKSRACLDKYLQKEFNVGPNQELPKNDEQFFELLENLMNLNLIEINQESVISSNANASIVFNLRSVFCVDYSIEIDEYQVSGIDKYNELHEVHCGLRIDKNKETNGWQISVFKRPNM